MLSKTEINLLRMLALGFGAEEIATNLGLDFKEFIGSYSTLLLKTNCWDETGLGIWWSINQTEYLDVLQNNIVCFDSKSNRYPK